MPEARLCARPTTAACCVWLDGSVCNVENASCTPPSRLDKSEPLPTDPSAVSIADSAPLFVVSPPTVAFWSSRSPWSTSSTCRVVASVRTPMPMPDAVTLSWVEISRI